MQAVKPNIVLAGNGYLNKFHFPNQGIVWRYQWSGATMYTTAHSGMLNLRFNLDGKGIDISEYNKTHPHPHP